MKKYALLLTLSCSPAIGQTTCTTIGNSTTCTPSPQSQQPNVGQTFLDNMQREQREQQAQQATAAENAAGRRAAAYAQVGELIAKGDCAAANRLATFYHRPDIMKDTARACPAP